MVTPISRRLSHAIYCILACAGVSEAMAMEARATQQPTRVSPPLQLPLQARPITPNAPASRSPARLPSATPSPSTSSAPRPPFASHRRKDARVDLPLLIPTTPVFGASAFAPKPAQLDMDLMHGQEEAKETEEQGTQKRHTTWESSRV
jgi:hypothetical protein